MSNYFYELGFLSKKSSLELIIMENYFLSLLKIKIINHFSQLIFAR
jgi:hypothetical protein